MSIVYLANADASQGPDGNLNHTLRYEIRNASAGDLPAIARLHAASWQAAYRGLLPDSFLDNGLEENRVRRWLGMLDRMSPRDRLLIALVENRLVGFISGWTPGTLECDPGFDLHINNVHVRPDLRGQGLGRSLMMRLANQHAVGAKTYLWVLDGNTPALRFYLKLGGRIGDPRQIELGGVTVGETRIVWDDFRPLPPPLPSMGQTV